MSWRYAWLAFWEEVMEIEYTSAMGEAGQRYIESLCYGSQGERLINPPSMPGNFRWHELLAHMLAAAPKVITPAVLEAVSPSQRLQLVEMYHDLNKTPGNTTRAAAEHMWHVGYRKYSPPLLQRMTSLKDRVPDPQTVDRVLVYTEGSDFRGEQFFDIKTEELLGDVDPESGELVQSEVAAAATHWMPLPLPGLWGDAPLLDEGDFSNRSRAELVHYIAQCRAEIDGLSLVVAQHEESAKNGRDSTYWMIRATEAQEAAAQAQSELSSLRHDKALGESLMHAVEGLLANPDSAYRRAEVQDLIARMAKTVVPAGVCMDEACAGGTCNSNMCRKSMDLLQLENPAGNASSAEGEAA
ncbi:DUF551 domain-containing protein [Noviherbaspirillum galbum]|uniref:DUF551 domain-containing protein n=1 Tax=Noviherbaspirillum galbum TaxID=2709383 RepID=A0A6B3SH32_9BURK|nr:DUF551 domain-containing protein [Noviherbaspirillum galbum]NEX60161.1 DUF551 domain-containing protein [Noviherbaspirillum galbum]